MCLMLHIRVVHFFAILKKESIYKKYIYLLSQEKYFPGLPNLGAQISSVQNWYTAVQADLKYFHKGSWTKKFLKEVPVPDPSRWSRVLLHWFE